MKLAYKVGPITWYDLIAPTKNEIKDLVEEFNIDIAIAQELEHAVERPKVQSFDNYAYLVLHFPELSDYAIDKVSNRNHHEVDFLIFNNTLITVHAESIPLVYEFSKAIELPSFDAKLSSSSHAGDLFIIMMRHFYTSIAVQLDSISRNLRKIEDKVFNNKEESMVHVLSHVNRKLLDLKKAIQFHGETLERLDAVSNHLFGSDYKKEIDHVLFEYKELSRTLASLKEITEDLWKTNDTLLTTKTNDVMRKLAAISFVTFPLSVIAALFGMNMKLPLVGGLKDFLTVLLGMAVVALCLVAYLQHKKWL